jgi:hypothetical protein
MSLVDDRALGLADLQAWLQGAITASPAHTRTDVTVADVVRPSSRMTAAQRLGVYRDAYFARLLECLADDYPALCALLGRNRFATVCQGYIATHAPRSATLNDYGQGFAEFCATPRFRESLQVSSPYHPALLRDLARIEWASVELIHAPIGIPLTGAEIQRHRAGFGAACLRAMPTLRLLRLEHAMDELYRSLRAGADAALPIPVATSSHELVYRVDWQIHCEALTASAGALLADLVAGMCIGDALSRAAERGASEQEIEVCFQRWVGAGFFASVT